jgi:ABC-2 type transport system permease protein
MMRAAIRPGSFVWLVVHDLRLNWRRFVDAFGGAAQSRALLLVMMGAVALHALAWPLVPLLAEHVRGPSTDVESRLAIGALLICVASWMVAQGLFAATRTLYDRGDLDLLYGSPIAPRRILAAKAVAIALSSLGSVAVLALPVANAGAVRFGSHWLAVYPALAGVALLATSLALGATILLFHTLGPLKARRYAHIAGALIGGAFVLGAQIVALLSDPVRQSITDALVPAAKPEMTFIGRLVWLPVDAMLAEPTALVALSAAGIVAFAGAALALGDRFAAASLLASGSSQSQNMGRAAQPVRFRSGPWTSLRRKEWRLLMRDPSLFSQLGLQIVYTIPLAVVLVRSGSMPLTVALAPAIVVIAAQVAASLAWIAVSGEDAPELIQSAPVPQRAVDLAKLSAIAVPVVAVAGLPAAGLALASMNAGLVTLAFAAAASVSTSLLNLWHPMPGNRRGMLRRHAQSKLIGLVEHLLAILWAMATVLALLGATVWPVPLLLVGLVLAVAHGGGLEWLGRLTGARGRASLAPRSSQA